MKNNEKGFSDAFALIVIFSLCVITLSFAMIILANEKKINSYKKDYDARKEADFVINNIETVLQNLKDLPCDTDEYEVSLLISGVCDFSFTVKDVSTGINKNFLSEEFLENQSIRQYIISNDKNIFTQYGWINPKITDVSFLDLVSDDFNNTDVFPLVNKMPLFNIYFMSEDFIAALLKYFNIQNANEKTVRLIDNLSSVTSIKAIAQLLEISETHSIFDLIGLKTAFWEVRFETDKYNCRAVFAAVPEKENHKNVGKYILVEKDISYNGGIL